MNADRDSLRQQRDEALRDVAELDLQVTAGEIPAQAATHVRADYERAAADAMAAFDRSRDDDTGTGRTQGRWARGRTIAYLVAGAVAVLVVAVLLPRSLGARPPGAAVSGDSALQTARPDAPGPARSGSDRQSRDTGRAGSASVAALLALGDRYLAEEKPVKAAQQYTAALRIEPGNAKAQAHMGWMLFRSGEPGQALQAVNRALESEPGMTEALWFKANIELYGQRDPSAAIAVLREILRRNDLSRTVHDQVTGLLATARRSAAGTGP